MGQKVNPIGLRLGIVKTWESKWYAGKNYAEYILEDHKIRKFVKEKLFHAGISRVEIERSSKRVRLRIYTSRPGIVIGKKGTEIALLKTELEKMVSHEHFTGLSYHYYRTKNLPALHRTVDSHEGFVSDTEYPLFVLYRSGDGHHHYQCNNE